jgi:uncharacterized repeat protein (TIGR03803 family)
MKTKNTYLISFALLIILLFTVSAVQAQNLWCSAFGGGATGGGTLLRMNMDGSGLAKVYDFVGTTGSSPMGSVLQAANGKVYATCINGGTDSSCVICSYDLTTNTYTDVWNFNVTQGDFPMSGLIQVPGGMLYGAASAGGASTTGVIYSFNTITNTYTDLYELSGPDGISPCGSPMLASDGKLYGITSGYSFYSGQTIGYGGIYSFDITNNNFTDLYFFGGIKDGFGFGSLIEHNGLLYGMTSGRPRYTPLQLLNIPGCTPNNLSAINKGNIFSFDPATQTYTSLYAFNNTDGEAPYGSLLLASDGKLYGMTSSGGTNSLGVIFNFDLVTNTYSKLYDFDSAHGCIPMGDLMQSADGKLYGATSAGGANSSGVIFRFDPVSNAYTDINDLSGTTGSAPMGGALAVVNPVLGFINPAGNESLSVFPVPAHDHITVNIGPAKGGNPLLTMTDINGRIVWGPQSAQVNGNSQINLDLGSLESGIYFLQATTGDNVITKKIIRE